MRRLFYGLTALLILFGISNGSVSARHVHGVSHQKRVCRLYHHAFYVMKHRRKYGKHAYKGAFRRLYKTEHKYGYSYNYRPGAYHHRWLKWHIGRWRWHKWHWNLAIVHFLINTKELF